LSAAGLSGSIVTLDQKLGTPVTILVNGKEVARGDLFVLDGEQDRLGVTITELAPSTGG
jgi:flagellar motor switch protein FliN/FliY